MSPGNLVAQRSLGIGNVPNYWYPGFDACHIAAASWHLTDIDMTRFLIDGTWGSGCEYLVGETIDGRKANVDLVANARLPRQTNALRAIFADASPLTLRVQAYCRIFVAWVPRRDVRSSTIHQYSPPKGTHGELGENREGQGRGRPCVFEAGFGDSCT